MLKSRVKVICSTEKITQRRKRVKQKVLDVEDNISYPWKKDILSEMNKLEKKINEQDEKCGRIIDMLKMQALYIEELRDIIVEQNEENCYAKYY